MAIYRGTYGEATRDATANDIATNALNASNSANAAAASAANAAASAAIAADAVVDTQVVADNIDVVTAIGNDLNGAAITLDYGDLGAVSNPAYPTGVLGAIYDNLDEVSLVAAIDGEIVSLAANTNAIADVGTAIDDVVSVATNINGTNTIGTVAASINNVNTVGTNFSSVTTVATDISNVNAVASNATNVNTVAGAIANVNATGSSIANVNTVATNLNGTDTIGTTATNIANVNTVGGSIASVNTTAGSISNVNTVATNIADIQTTVSNLAAILDADNQAAAASASASAASTSASNASNSAAAALVSENNAAASEASADADAATATAQATNASNSALAALTSQNAAASSASSASTSAGTATTKAAEAAASALSAVNAPGTSGTSTTSLTVAVGSITFTTQTSKNFVVGQAVTVARTSAAATTWMYGLITAYNSGTGSMTVSVTNILGSGTYTDWTIGLSGPLSNFDIGDIGTAPNEIPLNQYLGTMAYQDSTAVSVGTLNTSGNVTLSGGTANGVLYLDGSKVATSGSALTFDGSQFKVVSNQATNSVLLTRSGYFELSLQTTSAGGSDIYTKYTGPEANTDWLVGSSYVSGVSRALRFVYNGSEQMRLTSTGLGIGTSSPTQKFEVYKAAGDTLVYGGNPRLWLTTPTGMNGLRISGDTTPFELLHLTNGSSASFSGAMGLTINAVNATAGSTFTSSPTAAFLSKYWNGSASVSQMQGFVGMVATGATSTGGYFGLGIGSTSALRIDSSGNLGLGVTPSAWVSGSKSLTISNAVIGRRNNGASIFGHNFYESVADTFAYTQTGVAARMETPTSGGFTWHTAPSGSAGAAITFTQAMTLDASGKVGIGTTSPAYKLDVSKGSAGTAARFTASTDNGRGLSFTSSDNGIFLGAIWTRDVASGSGIHAWSINSSEKMRIDSSGNLGLGVTPSAWFSSNKVIDIGTRTALWTGGIGQPNLGYNCYVNTSGNFIYKATAAANYYAQDGTHAWYNAPSGTAGNTITFTQAMTLDASGKLLIGTTTAGASKLTVADDSIQVNTAKTPASATATGTTGQICWDADYVYVCVATNTWKRSAISTW